MKAPITQLVVFAASVGAVGCVGPSSAPTLTPRAEGVRVYSSDAKPASQCKTLGQLNVVDGNIDSSKGYMYPGARDRALVRLRNEAAALGGDAVVIEDEGDVLVVDGPEFGKYYINGRALHCSANP